jgi:DNA-binding protein HU-beta
VEFHAKRCPQGRVIARPGKVGVSQERQTHSNGNYGSLWLGVQPKLTTPSIVHNTGMTTHAMNKSDLIKSLADELGLDRNMLEVVCNRTFKIVEDALSSGDGVAIAGFGNFTCKDRAARQGRNPRTGETIEIAASKSVGFKPAKALKDRLNS